MLRSVAIAPAWRAARGCLTAQAVRALSTANASEVSPHRLLMQKYERDAALDVARQSSVINKYGVFANREVRLENIEVYGFDYDFTLAHYTADLQPLIYDLARDYMVKRLKYPAKLSTLRYNDKFPIRGLFYDRARGLLLKMDAWKYIQPDCVFFGHRRLKLDEIIDQYGGLYVTQSRMTNMMPLSDLFCLSEAALLSDVVQFFLREGMQFDPAYVFDDTRRAINMVHARNAMHDAITADLPRYLNRNDHLAPLLQRLKSAGKHLFLMTNSNFEFVDAGMSYLLGGSMPAGTTHWSQIFDYVVCAAHKPAFYLSDRPFRRVDPATGSFSYTAVHDLTPGGVYVHGNMKDFLHMTGYQKDSVIYVGDHIDNDLTQPVRHHGWRTCAIIKELEREVEIQNSVEFDRVVTRMQTLKDTIAYAYRTLDVVPSPDEEAAVKELKREFHATERAFGSLYNDNFGSVFKCGPDKLSMFSFMTRRFADVYTSQVENLLALPVSTCLFPMASDLPHERRRWVFGR